MKSVGIELVILIRCDYRRFLTFPSKFLMARNRCFEPSEDLVAMFLRLAEKHGIDFYFGTYDSSHLYNRYKEWLLKH